jgi:outer membrane receptor for monomeric catechols
VENSSSGQGSNIMMKKNKKKKSNHSGAFTGGQSQVRTPMDFESSMSSNSALMMMDGGTGSEHIKQHQQ